MTKKDVVPLVGTWIEIKDGSGKHGTPAAVVPLVGTWIEIYSGQSNPTTLWVVPLVVTWIGILWLSTKTQLLVSSPSRRRGLKSLRRNLFRRAG